MGGMSFLPSGYPYNQTPLGQSGAGAPNPSTMTPQQILEYYEALANTPQGQAAAAAQQQTIAFNVKTALAALQNERDRIAIARGQAEADRWYKQESLKLAQQAHQLAVQTQQQNYELSGAALTGQFQGNPTLANQAQTAMYTGLYNGQQTLQAQNQAQQFGLQQAGVTGTYQGAPTLAAQNQAQQYGLQLGAQTGYQGGNATLAREQAAASAAMEAARLGASLQGPANWAQYLQAANAVAGSPASALVASAPGGMGAMQGDPGGPMTLAAMLGQYGVMPGQGPSQPAQQAYTEPATGQMFAGGTPGFNEQTGSYSSAPAGGMRASGVSGSMAFTDSRGTNPVGGGQQGTRVPVGADPRGTNPVNPQDPNRSRYTTPVLQPGQPSAPQPWQLPAQMPPGWGTLSPQEQQRYQQLMARRQQLGQAGEGDLGAVDLDELSRFHARIGGRQAWNPQSVTGAIGQVASAPRVTNAQLGLTDQEAETLKSYIASPNKAASTWWTSKSGSQKEYLKGLGSYWGHDMNTFEERERNARPRQAAWNAAV